jgi:hypothetical protein
MATNRSVTRSELIGRFMERNPAATIAQVQAYLAEQHSLQVTEALIANVANRSRRKSRSGKAPAWKVSPAAEVETVEMEGVTWTIRPVVVGARPASLASPAAAAMPPTDAREPGAKPRPRRAPSRPSRRTEPTVPVSRRDAGVATARSGDAGKPVAVSPSARPTHIDTTLSIESLMQAKKMAEKLGGVSQARAALDTLCRLLD